MAPPLKRKLHCLKIPIAQLFFFAAGLWLLASLCFAQQPNNIRVAILQDAPSFWLKINGNFEISNSLNNEIIYRGRNFNATVTSSKEEILLGNIKCRTSKLFIKPANPDAVVIDGRRFRGSFQFIKKENSRLLVINFIEIEDYIKGILYHEVSHYWPMEALKAQAIVCRSYALYQMQQNKLKDFDVTCDIYSQVYGGLTSERYRTNKAVRDTKGEILTFEGKVLPAYFHATCAGRTEDASLLWNINLAPLKGVTCGFCKESPHFNWHYVLTLDEIRDKLNSSGNKIKKITGILILGRDPSSRVTDLKILTDSGELILPAKDFRNIISPNIIRSTNFSLSIVKEDVVFEGVGWGHGVGLCQWGAYFMAKSGKTHQKILEYYYPATRISNIN